MSADIKATVEELERLEREASPAPWPEEYCQGAVRHVVKNVDQDAFYDGDFDGWSRYKDGPLIAAARNALPSLLPAIRRWMAIEEAAVRYCEAVAGPEYADGTWGFWFALQRLFAALPPRKPSGGEEST